MKLKRILCYLLSLIMLMSAFVPVGVVSAAEDEEEFALSRDYLSENYVNEAHKLSTMTKYFENEQFELWALAETGEVGILDKTSGQILLTNPYDVASAKAADEVKNQLLSQIMLTYSDGTGAKVDFNSYADAAMNGQIKIKPTRKGIRVEYTIGKEQTKYLVPRQIEKTSFEENILSMFEDKNSREYKQIMAYFSLQDPSDPNLTSSVLTSMKVRWPITEKYAIYVLDSGISNRELEVLEGYIKNYTDYTEEKMVADYELVEYVDTSAAPAIFRFAIEYSLDEYGVEVRLPANSIKYDSSNYSLENVKFLPYFGAGNNKNEGFTLVPDGSGTITRFEDIKSRAFILTGKLYGRDYSFHSISGYTQETMRLPAFGVMQTAPVVEWVDETKTDSQAEDTAITLDESAEGEVTEGEAVEGKVAEGETQAQTPADENAQQGEEAEEAVPMVTSGFVAYLTEGDAMASVSADHGGTVHPYSSTYCTLYPKPVDTYALTGISSTGDATYTIYSDGRYRGNYTLRIFPISGEGSDYTDMASEVREYLTATGVLTKLDASKDTTDDVALYLENFGTIKTQQKVAGFPVQKQTPLTTFEQTKQMLEELKSNGIENVNVKLTGWYNGGMEKKAPAKLKVEKAVGGVKGLQELSEYASQNGVGIYPDIEFTYVGKFGSFDGFTFKRDAVKTIDDRSASHRVYSPLYQGFENDYQSIISPKAMTRFYEKISDDFKKLGTGGVSVGSLGYDLNSDHNDDYMLDREGAKEMISDFIGTLKADTGSVMIDGGNAYAIKNADHILNVPLDSSMNINTSQSVPFMGMVLHGSKEFAGTPINLDGDYDYSILKAIENGANLYYMVSKDNTSELKSFPMFNKYYAVGYENWKQDIFADYNKFNDAMKLVKYSYISEHEYIDSKLVRVAYDNGTEFILNYNTHDVVLEDGRTVEAMSFVN